MHISDTDIRAGQIIYWAENIMKERKGKERAYFITKLFFHNIFNHIHKMQNMINTVGSKHLRPSVNLLFHIKFNSI